MSLTLITGRAGSGKSRYILMAARAAAEAGRGVVLLVPTQADVARERESLAERGLGSVRVQRLDDYIDTLWSLAGDGRRIASPHQRRAFLFQASEPGGFSSRLAESATLPGFVRAMEPVIARLTEYDREDLSSQTPLDADILQLLDRYRSLVSGSGLVDRADAARALASAAPTDDVLLVDGMTDLSPRQRGVLVAWSRMPGVDVAVTLPWEEGFVPTRALDELTEELGAAGDWEKLPEPGRDDELGRLERGLFGPPVPEAGVGAVVFCEAAGSEAEVALIADRVRGLLANDEGRPGLGPEDIAITFRDASRRAASLGQALTARGIPVDLDVRIPCTATPFGRAFIQLIRFVTGQGRPEDLSGLARGPFLGIEHGAFDRIEAAWRSKAATDMARLVDAVEREDHLAASLLRDARRLAGQKLDPETLPGWKTVLDLMLARAFRTDDLPRSRQGADAARAHGAIVRALAELAVLTPAPTISDAAGVLDEVNVTAGPVGRPGSVLITEAHRVRSRSYGAVIVGGLTADEFSTSGRPSLSAEVAGRLTGLALPQDQDLERLLLYSVVTRAREHLEFVRLTADSEGRAIRPSVFWEQLLDLYRAPTGGDDAEGPHRDARCGVELALVAPMVTGDRSAVRRRACSGSSPNSRTYVLDEHTIAELAARDTFSATELETYWGCPFRWFYERMVRPRPIDAEVDYAFGGTLVHETMHDLYRSLPDALGARRLDPATLDAGLELADAIFEEAVSAHRARIVTLEDRDMVKNARAHVRLLVRADALFMPGYAPTDMLEHALGGNAGSVDLGGFRLKGRVDRVDEGPRGLVLNDYKWSAGDGWKRFEQNRRLQLPLYAAAIGVETGKEVVAAVYRSPGSGGMGWYRADLLGEAPDGVRPHDDIDGDALAELTAAALERARTIIGGIRSGIIEPDGSDARSCQYCAYADLCDRRA